MDEFTTTADINYFDGVDFDWSFLEQEVALSQRLEAERDEFLRGEATEDYFIQIENQMYSNRQRNREI